MSDPNIPQSEGLEDQNQIEQSQTAGRRHKRHSKHHRHHKNSWLSHVKATMKQHKDKSFKQILKLAKKSYKKSQSQSQKQQQQQGGNKSRNQRQRQQQQGGSGMKTSTFGENAAAYPSK